MKQWRISKFRRKSLTISQPLLLKPAETWRLFLPPVAGHNAHPRTQLLRFRKFANRITSQLFFSFFSKKSLIGDCNSSTKLASNHFKKLRKRNLSFKGRVFQNKSVFLMTNAEEWIPNAATYTIHIQQSKIISGV